MFDVYPRPSGGHYSREHLHEACTALRKAFKALFPTPIPEIPIWASESDPSWRGRQNKNNANYKEPSWEFVADDSWCVRGGKGSKSIIGYDVPDSSRRWAFFAPLFKARTPLIKLQEAVPELRALQEPLHTCQAMGLTLKKQTASIDFNEGRFGQTIELIISSPWILFGMWLPRHLRTLDVVKGKECKAYIFAPPLELLDEKPWRTRR